MNLPSWLKLPHVSAKVAVVLAVVAGVAEIVQQYAIPASSNAHNIISFALVLVVGVGIVPLTGKAIGKLIPIHWAAALTAAAGALQVLQQSSLSVPPVAHSVIAVALLIFAALGIVPHVPPVAAVASRSDAGRSILSR